MTLEDHPFEVNLSFFVDSYISDSQEILISLCSRPAPSGSRSIYSVNASSIVTGECLATITSEDPNCSEIRKAALNPPVFAFGYDRREFLPFGLTNSTVM